MIVELMIAARHDRFVEHDQVLFMTIPEHWKTIDHQETITKVAWRRPRRD